MRDEPKPLASGNLAGATANLWDWSSIGRFERWTARLRRRPDFLIIGAQRAGTTSLYDALCRQPQIRAAAVKETHFFTQHFARGPLFYRSLFPLNWGAPFLTGEATPYYLFHPLVPQRAAQFLPNAKMLVLLRNPIDRAYSHFQMTQRRAEEPLDFAAAIAAEPTRLAPETPRVMAGDDSPPHRLFSYLSRGHYAEQLERWFAAFGRERFWIVASEEFSAQPGETLASASEFLGLKSVPPGAASALNEAKYDALEPELRAQLRDYFAPHNARLEELLGRKFAWE